MSQIAVQVVVIKDGVVDESHLFVGPVSDWPEIY